jgi:carbon storage regulator
VFVENSFGIFIAYRSFFIRNPFSSRVVSEEDHAGSAVAMLVLTRTAGERIVMPRCEITVTVLSVLGDRVRLGITAPQDIGVYREELWRRNSTENGFREDGSKMSIRIMIADSDEYLLSSYSEHFHQLGATVATAASGLECIEKIRESVPDVLILEPLLLWGGGEGVLALLKENPELRPSHVILLTQSRNRSLHYRLSTFKFDDYQIKPLTCNRLGERVARLLRHKPFLSPS